MVDDKYIGLALAITSSLAIGKHEIPPPDMPPMFGLIAPQARVL